MASKLMVGLSPSTSAHLSAEKISFGRSKEPPQAPTRACGGCGTLSIPGWNAPTLASNTGETISHEPSSTQKQPAQTRIRRGCKVCGRVTQVTSAPAIKPKRHPVRPSEPVKVRAAELRKPALQVLQKAPEPKVSSKKRARARKDREGLQVLLNRSKAVPAKPGLGLMDFMKS
jgi:hypothetical protein